MNIDDNPAVIGEVYEVRSRNLLLGVWDGEKFIGIRTKFGDEYLFGEYPETSDGRKMPFETVREWKTLGAKVPEGIPLVTSLESQCGKCKGKIEWSGPPAPAPWICENKCEKAYSVAPRNKALFDFLEELSIKHGLTHEPSPRSLKEIIENNKNK